MLMGSHKLDLTKFSYGTSVMSDDLLVGSFYLKNKSRQLDTEKPSTNNVQHAGIIEDQSNESVPSIRAS